EKLTALNWLVMISATTLIFLFLKASPWIKTFVPITIGLVMINNWFVALVQTDYTEATAHAATFGFMMAHLPLLHSKIRDILAHPEKRWWLRTPRKKVQVPTFVGPFTGEAFKANTFDLSEGGAFIVLSKDDRDNRGTTLPPHLEI